MISNCYYRFPHCFYYSIVHFPGIVIRIEIGIIYHETRLVILITYVVVMVICNTKRAFAIVHYVRNGLTAAINQKQIDEN